MTANLIARDDWTDVRFRYLAEVQKGCLPSPVIDTLSDIELVPYLTMEYLRGGSGEPTFVPFNDKLVMASDGSILLIWDGANSGEFLRAKRGVVSSTSALVTPKSIDPTYFYWACKGQEDQLRAQTVGMDLLHVNGEFLANMRIGVPPLPQQRAIADYLDRETARLDALVAANERVFNLLAERRGRSLPTLSRAALVRIRLSETQTSIGLAIFPQTGRLNARNGYSWSGTSVPILEMKNS